MATRWLSSRAVSSRIGALAPALGRRLALDRLDGVAQDVDQDLAQPFRVGRRLPECAGSSVQTERSASCRPPPAARTASVASALMSAGASSNLIGRAKSRTSVTIRFRRAISSSMSRVARFDLIRPRPSPGASVRSAVLMIISGLRISWATTVDSRPSDDSRSRCVASRWNRWIESVIELKRRREQARVLVLPAAVGRHRDPPRQVAGGRHLAHRRGNRAERPRDRARDGVAQERGRQHRQRPPSRPSIVCSVRRNRRRSVRERRIERGRQPGRPRRRQRPASGRCTRCRRCAHLRRDARDVRSSVARARATCSSGSVAAWTSPSRGKRDLAVGQGLEPLRRPARRG